MGKTARFSIIIPTYNRPRRLAACLQSLAALDYPAAAWEVIVVNDGGADPAAVVEHALSGSFSLRLINVDHGGPARARNAGATLARGDFLAFTDDDCWIDPGWLRHFATGFESGPWGALGGQVLNAFSDNPAAAASQHLVNFLYSYMQDADGNALLLFSGSAAYKRSVFEALGGFDETFLWAAGEDSELSYRLLVRGYRQRYWLAARVWHCHRLTRWGFVGQQFRFGRSSYFLQQALKRIDTAPSPPCSQKPFYMALGQSLWRARVPLAMWLLVGFSQAAYRAGNIYQTARAYLGLR